MANRRFIDFPIASTVGDNDIVLIWQDGANKQTTKATILSGLPENLDELNDVVISGLTNGQILRYDSVTGKWVNTDQGNLDLNDLNDVSIVSPSNGQVLVYNSLTSKWENSSGGFVPYVGAVTTVDLGAQGLRAGYVRFDTSVVTVPDEQGLMYWDASRSTVALIMNGTLQHIGQDSFFYVKNSSGSTIPKGTCVGFAGTDGGSGHLLVTPFLANGSVPSTYFMGVTAEAIANGSFGQVMHFGELEGINTSGFTAGALLYASSTVAGGFQTTAPVAPNNIILVAAAVNSKNNGAIVVRPTLGSNFGTNESVKLTSVANLDLLQYQSGTGVWENKTLAQVIGSAYVPSTRTLTINGTAFDLSANRSWTVGDVRTDGSYSNPSWITALAWSKITGTPTTLSGYGITDAYTETEVDSLLTGYVTLNTFQNISGSKIFGTNRLIMDGEGTAQPTSLSNTQTSNSALSSHNSFGFNGSNNIYFNKGTTANGGIFAFSNTATRTYTLKDASGTLAFTSDIPANPVGGTGTTNYLPKFTGSTTIGNSALQDDGTNVYVVSRELRLNRGTYSGFAFGIDQQSTFAFGSTNGKRVAIIYDSTAADNGLQFGYDTVDKTGIIAGAATSAGAGIDFYTYNGSAWGNRARVTASGNLLVGTTSDNGARLQVSGAGTFSGTGLLASVRINNTTASTGKDWHFYSLNNGNFGLFNNTDGSYAYQVTPSGNLGLGVTPSSWTLLKPLEIGNAGNFFAGFQGGSAIYMGTASYYNSGWKYATTGDAANLLDIGAGAFTFSNAASGTAGNSLTWTPRMTLNASGNLLVGTTTDNGARLQVSGGGTFSDTLIVSTANASNKFQITSTTGTNAAYQRFTNSGGNYYIGIDNSAGTALFVTGGVAYGFGIVTESAQSIVLGTNNIARLTIAHTTGAATFSSSVSTNGRINAGTGGDSFYWADFLEVRNSMRLWDAANSSFGLRFGFNSNTPYLQGFRETVGVTNLLLQPSGGNVLIGTTTDNGAKLQVSGRGTFIADGAGNANSGISGSQLVLSRTSGLAENVAFRNTGGSNGIGGTNFAGQIISNGNNIFEIYVTGAQPMIFGTNSTERIRITSGAAVGIGKTSSITGLDIFMSSADVVNARTGQGAGTATSLFTGWNSASATTSGTLVFNVTSNGNVTNTNGSYGTLSDISLKENIVDATPKLADLLQLKVRNFNLIGSEEKQIGFIAQELEEIFPKMVDVNGINKMKSIKTSVLVPMLVKAIQELKQEIDTLKN